MAKVILSLLVLADIFGLIMLAKCDVTNRQRTKIRDAIHEYHYELIRKRRFGSYKVDYNDMETYNQTLFRLWDWGPTRILPPEKYEIIKQYIEDSHAE
jgi:hypothetical protein